MNGYWFTVTSYLSSFCDVEKNLIRQKGLRGKLFVTNLVEKRFCIRHVVKDQKYLRRVDSKSFTRIAIAVSCSLASIGASSSGTAVVGVSWEYSVIFS